MLDADHQGLLALRAAAAAAEQGDDAFARFHRQVMELRHGQQRTLTRRPSPFEGGKFGGVVRLRSDRTTPPKKYPISWQGRGRKQAHDLL